MCRLHQEIEDFAEYIAPTPEEMKMRDSVFERIKAVVLSLWPKAQVRQSPI
jgi:non-canonical poly(A) RNA polymerase PAPD5/7